MGSYMYFKMAREGWQLALVVTLEGKYKPEEDSFPHMFRMLVLGKKYNVHLTDETCSTIEESP